MQSRGSSLCDSLLNPAKERQCIGVDGKDGRGEMMTPQ